MADTKHVIRVGDMQTRARTISAPQKNSSMHRRETRLATHEGVSFAERLLRDCALCTAAMLCILGLGNTDQPVAAMTAQRLSEVATTDLETDEILGQLKFVHNLFPESVQVFWSSTDGMQRIGVPSQAEVVHTWVAAEPWIGYEGDQKVFSCAAGEVMNVTPMEDGTYALRIRHDNELESIYSQLSACLVREGETIEQGAMLGSAQQLLFEVRKEGREIDPGTLM